MAVTLFSSPHALYLGESRISPEVPSAQREAPIKDFDVFYDERVIVGFHILGENEEEPEFILGDPPFRYIDFRSASTDATGFYAVWAPGDYEG